MTREEKDLLIKDLCTRLPYRTKIHIIGEGGTEIDADLTTSTINYFESWTVQPYLRPMSSMTKEEDHEFALLQVQGGIDECKYLYACDAANMITWLNRHHFDYQGLIEKGLALEAPKDMYKEE